MHFPTILTRIVLVTVLTMALACAGPPQIADTEESRLEMARTIARLSVASGSLKEMIDDGAQFAQAATAESLKLELERELTEDEEARVRAIFEEALAGVLTRQEYEKIISSVVAENFSAPEMTEALAFYQSPAGAKILRLEVTLAKEVDARTDALFDEHMDEFIARVDKEMEDAFEELRDEDGQ